MEWDAVEVKQESPLTLMVRFRDGVEGRIRFEPSHLQGVFAPLNAPAVFSEVRIKGGALSWSGEVDLSPDAMYDEIKPSGEWVPR